MNKTNKQLEKSQTILLLLYPAEDETHKVALSKVSELTNKYAFIKHDKDIYDFDDVDDLDKVGTPKKEHYHVVLNFKSQRYARAIAKKLGIKENYAKCSNSLDDALAYLTHLYHKEKHQYELRDITCSSFLRSKLIDLHNNVDLTESDVFLNISNYILSQVEFLHMHNFTTYCVTNGYYSIMRKNYTIFKDLIYERNMYIQTLKLKNQERIYADSFKNKTFK